MKPRQHREFLDRIKGFKVCEACGFPLGGFIDGMKKRYYLAYARNAEVAQHASPISLVLPFGFRLCAFQTCISRPRFWRCSARSFICCQSSTTFSRVKNAAEAWGPRLLVSGP